MLNSINQSPASSNQTSTFNPYVAVLDHETIVEAVARHRRQTGHKSYVMIVRLPD